MKVIEQYEQDGYIIRKYENGSVEKIIISSEEINNQQKEINNQQEDIVIDYNIAKINTDLEYIKCLLEDK